MTPHQNKNVCDWETIKRDQPSKARLSFTTCAHRKSGKPNLPTVAINDFEKRCTSSFQPSKLLSQQGGSTNTPCLDIKFRRNWPNSTSDSNSSSSRVGPASTAAIVSCRSRPTILCASPHTAALMLCRKARSIAATNRGDTFHKISICRSTTGCDRVRKNSVCSRPLRCTPHSS